MGYAQELMRLLQPLGVYTFRDGSFSMAQLEALGAQMDALRAVLEENQRESLVMSAQGAGLDRVAALFPHPVTGDAAQRRMVLAALMQVSGDGFTPDALRRCLPACGAACALEETDTVNQVRIRFPELMGIPAEFTRMRRVIEDLLPAQVEIEYCFRWCTWGETMQYGLTWKRIAAMRWQDWRVYRE